jgi:RNA polymerase sigma factor (sigma-70 family)
MDPSFEIEELLQRMGNGDPSAKTAVLDHFYTPMRRVARAILRRESSECSLESRELVHQVVLSRFSDRRIPLLPTAGDFLAFTRYVMRQIVIDRGRRRAIRRKYLQMARTETGKPIPRELEIAVAREFRALSALDRDAARIVLSRHVKHLTWEEISESTGIPIRTARTRYNWAIAWLRQRLRK